MGTAKTEVEPRLLPTTPLNDAIKRMANGDTGAASVIAMLNAQRPQNVMAYLHALDKMRVYGHGIYSLFWGECSGNLDKFSGYISSK